MTNEVFLNQYNEAFELATELFDGIWEDAAMWMQTPSPLCFDLSPAQAIAAGEGHLLIEWLEVRTGKKPGAAF